MYSGRLWEREVMEVREIEIANDAKANHVSAGLRRLLSSSKLLLALLSMLAVVGLAYRGQLAANEALDFCKWVLGFVFGATALEDAARKWGMGRNLTSGKRNDG
jgi:hypothetical protein